MGRIVEEGVDEGAANVADEGAADVADEGAADVADEGAEGTDVAADVATVSSYCHET